MTSRLSTLISCAALGLSAMALRKAMIRHDAELARLRADLKIYDAVCRRGGDAEEIMIFRRGSTTCTWVDIVLKIKGLTLRYPIRSDQVEAFVKIIRGEDWEPMPAFLPDQ